MSQATQGNSSPNEFDRLLASDAAARTPSRDDENLTTNSATVLQEPHREASAPGPNTESRDVTDSVSWWKRWKRVFRHSTFWIMTLYFILGLAFSVAHHWFYHLRNRKPVGSSASQQWALRFGTLCAFLVHTFFSRCARYAYDQWLWKKLRNKAMSIETLDAAFSADASLLVLLNGKLLKESIGLPFIALLIHLLPIATVLAPATLSQYQGQNFENMIANVTKLDFSTVDPALGINQPSKVAVWVSANGSNNNSEVLTGPKTDPQRLAVATAATGEILPFSPPFLNSTYQLTFDGPGVQCSSASPDEIQVIDTQIRALESSQEGSITHEIDYIAFVPVFSSGGNESTVSSAILGNRLEQPANASNELWMAFTTYNDGSSCWNPEAISLQYIVCRLVNTSYTVDLKFENGVQTITGSNYTLGNVSYPQVDGSIASNLTQFAYSAYMWAFSNLIIGSIGLYSEILANSSVGLPYSRIQTQIQSTVLLGSSDLDVFFDNEHIWTGGPPVCQPIGQRQQDIGLARNESLSILIQELSFNTTMSFFTNEILA